MDATIRNLKVRFQTLSPTRKFVLAAFVLLVLYMWLFTSFSSRTAEETTVVVSVPLIEQKININTERMPVEEEEEEEEEEENVAREQKPGSMQVARTKPIDSALVVLGYTLHNDGMPQRILKNRVDSATAHYLQMVKYGKHPLVIYSGKGKKGEYTEAVAMKELGKCSGVPEEDVILEDQSASTVENAIRVGEILKKRNIKELVVVTSDYHVLRSQYIFNTVLDTDVQLMFIGADSGDYHDQGQEGEYQNFISSLDELQRFNVITNSESYGYHPIRNLPRWKMIERELNADIIADPELTKKSGKEMTFIDYGSNYGYFSIHLAQKFPKGVMVSLEGEAWNEYKGAASFHKTKMEELKITNNYLCKTRTQPEAFAALVAAKQVYRYQLCLSVFHWFDMPTRESFEIALRDHFLNARTTFIELPEARDYDGHEGQHAWSSVNIWYGGRSEVQIIQDIAEKYKMGDVNIKILGGVKHDNKTVRKLIRVDFAKHKPNVILEKALEAYQCTENDVFHFEK